MKHDQFPISRTSRQARQGLRWTIVSVDRRAQRPQNEALDGTNSDLSGCGISPLTPLAPLAPRKSPARR
jgi:hypothetical protein